MACLYHRPGAPTCQQSVCRDDGTYAYAYDDEGNLILQTLIADYSTREFTCDHRNRLTSVADYSAGGVITSSVTYTYDALNRRILKDDGVTQTAYSYDGSDVQLEFVNGVMAVRYFQGLGIDDVFAEENVGLVGDAGLDWLLSDRQGTIKDVLDGSGDLAQHVIFDTYGNLLEITDGAGAVQTVNDLLTEYGFTSRRYETETGLWYFRARYYNSELGRFISRDPAGFVDGPSLYAGYFASQWGTDPTGMQYRGPRYTHTWWGLRRAYESRAAKVYAAAGWYEAADRADADYHQRRRRMSLKDAQGWKTVDEMTRMLAPMGTDEIDALVNGTHYDLMDGIGKARLLMALAKLRKIQETQKKRDEEPCETDPEGGIYSEDGHPKIMPDGTVNPAALKHDDWHVNAPHQINPGSGPKTMEHMKYNPKTKTYERSTVHYDEFGRQSKRTDHTDHGYGNPNSPDYHSNPHDHYYEYDFRRYSPKGRERRVNRD